MPKTFLFIGRSGCGKGTQANLLIDYIAKQDKTPTTYVEVGDFVRDFISKPGYSNDLSRKVYESGQRQPSFLACFMWSKKLLEDYDGNSHLIFDGAPRALVEAEVLETALDFFGFKGSIVFHLEVSRDWSKRRLFERKRRDDLDPEEVEKRLDWFDRDTLPAIEFFEKNKNFNIFKINGESSVEDVHREIVSKIEPLLLK